MANTLDKLIHRLENSVDPMSPPTSLRVSKPFVPDLTESRVFLTHLMHLSAIRCAMASWGQPLEAIIASLLLSDPTRKH